MPNHCRTTIPLLAGLLFLTCSQAVAQVPSEIAEKIVSQLKAKLSPQEKADIEEKPTNDLAAYDLYLRARDLVDALAFGGKDFPGLPEAGLAERQQFAVRDRRDPGRSAQP